MRCVVRAQHGGSAARVVRAVVCRRIEPRGCATSTTIELRSACRVTGVTVHERERAARCCEARWLPRTKCRQQWCYASGTTCRATSHHVVSTVETPAAVAFWNGEGAANTAPRAVATSTVQRRSFKRYRIRRQCSGARVLRPCTGTMPMRSRQQTRSRQANDERRCAR